MNCKKAAKHMVLLADNELDEVYKQAVMDHINNCQKCRMDYETICSMRKILHHDPYLVSMEYDILKPYFKGNPDPIKGGFFVKKKLVAVFTLIFIITGIFVPFGGKSFAQTAQEWLKSLSFTVDNTNLHTKAEEPYMDINITADLNLEEYYKNREVYEADMLANTDINKYSNIEEAKKNGCTDFKNPGYIPSGLKLESVNEFIDKRDSDYRVVKLLYIPDGTVLNSVPGYIDVPIENLTIAYSNTQPSNVGYREDARLRKVDISGIPAYIVATEEKGISIIGLQVMMSDRQLSVGMSIPHEKSKYDTIAKAEQELIKIAESILK